MCKSLILGIWNCFQNRQLSIVVHDNLLRPGALNITYRLHTQPTKYGSARQLGGLPSYSINISVSATGTYLLEIFLVGVQVRRVMFGF